MAAKKVTQANIGINAWDNSLQILLTSQPSFPHPYELSDTRAQLLLYLIGLIGTRTGYDHMTDTFYNPSFTKKSFYDDKKWLETGQLDKTALAGKANLTSGTMGSFKSNHPSKDFLKGNYEWFDRRTCLILVLFFVGALWLGRNLTLVVEDLSYRTEKLYDKCRRDVMRIEEDSDELRCRQRLVLLLRSIVSSTVSMTSKCRDRSRNILQVIEPV
jgi:hypothetical protein